MPLAMLLEKYDCLVIYGSNMAAYNYTDLMLETSMKSIPLKPISAVCVFQRVIFNIVNFSKTKSLYRDGMAPMVKSTIRPKW